MPKITKQDIAKIIMQCASLYAENLCNRNYLVVYNINHNNILKPNFIETVFLPRHFRHLTGVKTSLQANDFYKRSLSNRLSSKDFEVPQDGTCQLKMQVLPYLMKLHKHANSTGVFSNGQGIYIHTKRLIGSRRSVMGFAQCNEGDNIYYFPNTALNEDINKLSNERHRILAMLRKQIKDALYSDVCYIAKGLSLNDIKPFLLNTGKCASVLINHINKNMNPQTIN